jgi:hypothetical protein
MGDWASWEKGLEPKVQRNDTDVGLDASNECATNADCVHIWRCLHVRRASKPQQCKGERVSQPTSPAQQTTASKQREMM